MSNNNNPMSHFTTVFNRSYIIPFKILTLKKKGQVQVHRSLSVHFFDSIINFIKLAFELFPLVRW